MNLSELKVPIEKLFIDYIIDLVRKIEVLDDRIKELECDKILQQEDFNKAYESLIKNKERGDYNGNK